MTLDEKFMLRCLDLARLGKGFVAPNPMVGSVVVFEGEIIGEGYHMQYGEAHAEVNAINAVKDKSLLKKSTLYVILEPCAHHGKTPPCSDLIIKCGIPKVVIGCVDSFSEVAGKGIARMIEEGVDVKVGVMEKESLDLNRRFFTFHEKKRPYIILKWAQSKDGFIDIERSNSEKGVFWITQPETKIIVHKWRHEEAGILVGRNTVAIDNPSLNCRDFNGNAPTRFVIDENMKLDYGAFYIGDRTVQTYIITKNEVISKGKLQFIQPTDFTISSILKLIHSLDIQSVIIEGGAKTIQEFISADSWDEARILTGVNTIEKGLKAPELTGNISKTGYIGKDQLTVLRNA